jgi:hypothetical protein
MGQELAASSQLSAQMGLGGGGGGGTGGTGGNVYGVPTSGQAGDRDAGGAAAREGAEFERFMQDMLGDQIAIATRAGYSPDKAISEGARRAEGFLQSLKRSGDLPADYTTPSLNDLTEAGQTMSAANQGNFSSYGRNADGSFTQGTGPDSMTAVRGRLSSHGGAETMLPQYFAQEGQENVVGVGPDGQPIMGIPTPGGEGAPGGAGGGGGGGAQTADDILARAGLEGLDPELRDQFMGEIMRSAETDPELAEYLGLTEESRSVGADYQELPAYMRAMEQGTEQVLQSGAGAGTLYSGRRGEEVSRMAHDVEGQYYDRAQREQESMMGRRMGQRGAELGMMGTEVAGGRARKSDAYNQYMSQLMQMSQPTATTNVGSMRQAAATGQGANLMSGARAQGGYRTDAATASGAAMADVAGGIMEMGSAWIDRPQ